MRQPFSTRRPLTDIQRHIWYLLYALQQTQGRSPTYKELGEYLGVSGRAVNGHVQRLQKKGYVRQLPGRLCAIQVMKTPPAPGACAVCPFQVTNGVACPCCRHPVWSTRVQAWGRVILEQTLRPVWCPMARHRAAYEEDNTNGRA